MLKDNQEILEFVAANASGKYTLEQAEDLHSDCGTDLSVGAVIQALIDLGLRQCPKDQARQRRKSSPGAGFSRNPHTRWQECPSHGGSGLARGVWTGAGRASHTPG